MDLVDRLEQFALMVFSLELVEYYLVVCLLLAEEQPLVVLLDRWQLHSW